MNAKLAVNLATGLIEAEGTQEFVSSVYADLREVIVARSNAVPIQSNIQTPPADESDQEAEDGGTSRKSRRRSKPSGPSCASRIQGLGAAYFSDLRAASDVRDKLSEKGTAYEARNVAAALIDLVRRGALRRVKQNGTWMYQNP